jgi:hypothetical protein
LNGITAGVTVTWLIRVALRIGFVSDFRTARIGASHQNQTGLKIKAARTLLSDASALMRLKVRHSGIHRLVVARAEGGLWRRTVGDPRDVALVFSKSTT